jgi:hypothetical protein
MKFDIVITHIGNLKAKNIVARHLAHDPSISLQKAMSMLENPPVVYIAGVLKEDAQYHVRQLEKIQVTAKLVEVQLAPLLPHAVAPFVPEHPPAPATPTPQPPQPKQPAVIPPSHPAAEQRRDANGAFGAGGAGSGEKMSRKKIIAVASVFAVLAVIVVILALRGVFDWGHAFSLDWSKAGLVSGDNALKKHDGKKQKKMERAAQESADKKDGRGENAGNDSVAAEGRDEATDEQKSKAEAYVESGKNASDMSQAISFYQLAIAFNKRNVTAWYALHDSYVSAQMSNEAETTDKTMRRLFGDNIFSVAKIMEPFGTIVSTSLTRDGIYRVEFKPRESDPAKTLADSYLLARALKNSCLCNALSLYARTSAGKGLLVYVRTESFPASFDEYKASANITYLK